MILSLLNISPGRMEHMSTFVREMENDLSHGDNMFSMVFTKESNNCLPSSPSYGRVLLCKRCSRLTSCLRFKILSRPLSQQIL
jgi:hypothetical protein